jgi:hypothetical protein
MRVSPPAHGQRLAALHVDCGVRGQVVSYFQLLSLPSNLLPHHPLQLHGVADRGEHLRRPGNGLSPEPDGGDDDHPRWWFFRRDRTCNAARLPLQYGRAAGGGEGFGIRHYGGRPARSGRMYSTVLNGAPARERSTTTKNGTLLLQNAPAQNDRSKMSG